MCNRSISNQNIGPHMYETQTSSHTHHALNEIYLLNLNFLLECQFSPLQILYGNVGDWSSWWDGSNFPLQIPPRVWHANPSLVSPYSEWSFLSRSLNLTRSTSEGLKKKHTRDQPHQNIKVCDFFLWWANSNHMSPTHGLARLDTTRPFSPWQWATRPFPPSKMGKTAISPPLTMGETANLRLTMGATQTPGPVDKKEKLF